MVVHLTCKNDEDLIKNEGAVVVTSLSLFFQTLKDSWLSSQWLDLDEI